jgi:plasmid stabilization system protein ParE
MPQFAVEFHPLAANEAKAAERWYRERNEIASARFQREIDRAVDLISERPNCQRRDRGIQAWQLQALSEPNRFVAEPETCSPISGFPTPPNVKPSCASLMR